MRKAVKITGGILLAVVSFLTFWAFFFVLADEFSFYLSTTNIKFASYDMVIRMFNLSVFAGFVLAFVTTAICTIFYFKSKRRFHIYVVTYVIVLCVLMGYVLFTDNLIASWNTPY